MYINLAWTPLNGTDPIAIEAAIFAELTSARVKFVDIFTPWDGLFLASIAKGSTQSEIQALHRRLRAIIKGPPPLEFSYVITVSPNFQDLFRSADLTDPIYRKLVEHET